MPMRPLEYLAQELGLVAARVEREMTLRVSAAIADLEKRDAERQLELERFIQKAASPAVDLEKRDAERQLELERFIQKADADIEKRDGERQLQVERFLQKADVQVADMEKRDGERQLHLERFLQKADVQVADIEKRDGERQLQLERFIQKADAHVASLKNGRDGKDGEVGKDGKDGKDGVNGKFEGVKSWVDGIHYEGAIVTHDGSTYLAVKNTAQSPPHDDWQLIAAKGADAPVGQVHGLYAEGTRYRKFDLVAFNGCEWRARRDDPGEPGAGDGWALAARQGKKGDKGDPGKQGDPGPRGPAATDVVLNGMVLTVLMDDSTIMECDLRPAFEMYHSGITR